MPPQQPVTEYGAEQSAQQQPDQAAQCAVPEPGQGELRIAQHFDARDLFPAAHDQRIGALWMQLDQTDKPAGNVLGQCRCAALDQHLLILDVDDPDAAEIAAVENRTDHRLDHCRVVDLRGQR
ncbi:hypothetical protein D3C86_1548960 [compost metagenome]